MESNLNLMFETLQNTAGFRLTTSSSNSVDVIFTDSPIVDFSGHTSSTVMFQASDEIKATVFNSDEKIVLYLTKNTTIPQAFSLKFNNIASITKIDDTHLKLNVYNSVIYIELQDCNINSIDNNSASIIVTNSDAIIQFSLKSLVVNSLTNVTMQSLDDNRMVIAPSKRIPEFIISVFDDSEYNYPRHMRFGVPVISTVPTVPQSGENIYQEDKDLLELGVGTDSRKMHFLVASDQKIDAALRDNLTLEIDLPSGSDTVVETASIPLEYVKTVDTNDIFSCKYVFNKEDTVNYVDGFAYLSVKMPLRIQRNLPLIFQVTSDGTNYEDVDGTTVVEEASGGIDISEGEIQPLSVGNIVQPKLINGKQGSGTKNGKNKKSSRKPKA
jgi:hypothetical protein